MKAAIFDIDGTLAPEVSWLSLTRDLGASVPEHQAIFDSYKAGRLPYAEAKRRLIGLWQATGHATHAEFERLCRAWPLDPSAPDLIRDLQDRGYQLCLITGSFDIYAQTMARRLAVEHYYANTETIFDPSGQIVDFQYEIHQAAKKLNQFHRFCTGQALDPSDCYVVGDSDSELELFRATRRGILIDRPDHSPELRAAAWRVVPDLAAVRALILSNGAPSI